jgi:hypothetical protein
VTREPLTVCSVRLRLWLSVGTINQSDDVDRLLRHSQNRGSTNPKRIKQRGSGEQPSDCVFTSLRFYQNTFEACHQPSASHTAFSVIFHFATTPPQPSLRRRPHCILLMISTMRSKCIRRCTMAASIVSKPFPRAQHYKISLPTNNTIPYNTS